MLAHLVRMLGGIPDREQVILGLIIRDQPSWLHGGRREPLHLVGLPDHVLRLRERGRSGAASVSATALELSTIVPTPISPFSLYEIRRIILIGKRVSYRDSA